MILTVDAGNTTIAVGGFVNGKLSLFFKFPTKSKPQMNEYLSALEPMIKHLPIKGIIVSSVVPTINTLLLQSLEHCTHITPILYTTNMNPGFSFGNYPLENLGTDRIADLAGAKKIVQVPIIVFDLGTCTTTSIIDHTNTFLGGMIQPGICLSLNAMHEHTGRLPQLFAREATSLIGANTEDCMINGTIISAAATIDGFTSRIEKELGYHCNVVVTGGMGNLVIPMCQRDIYYNPHLILIGLYQIYELNCHA